MPRRRTRYRSRKRVPFWQRRSRRASGFEVLWYLVLGMAWLIVALIKALWRLARRYRTKGQPTALITGKRTTSDLRKMPEWCEHYRSARSAFVFTCDQVLGPENLRCACCQVTFKVRGRRGFHVDHIRPVATHPHLSFDVTNFQLLCSHCNTRKRANQPLTPERRSKKLVLALERERREWLRRHGDVDPIYKLLDAHEVEPGSWATQKEKGYG